jgi:hypothetical protein
MEAMLRQADASLEKWFLGAKQRGAGILRHRVDDLQAGLQKLSAGLEQVERKRAAAPREQPEPSEQVTPRTRRPRTPTVRKPAASRKRKKAA